MLEVPATMAMVRRTTSDRREAVQGWANQLCATARRFPGYQGGTIKVLRTGGRRVQVVIGLRFATAADLAVWEASSERARALAMGAAITDATTEPVPLDVLTGGDWGSPPTWLSRIRSVAVVWIALFPTIVLLNLILDQGRHPGPVVERTLVTTVLLVPIVVLVTGPAVGRAFTVIGRAFAHRQGRSPD